MTKILAIIEPIPPAAIVSNNSNSGAVVASANLLTPDPKEVYDDLGGGFNRTIDVDLGSVQSIDSFFLGYLGGTDGTLFTLAGISGGAAAYADATIAVGVTALAPTDIAVPIERHYFVQLAAPVNARYIRFTLGTPSVANHYFGVLAIGKALPLTWGHEYGAGRPVEDTSEVDRLFGGGFGINQGVTAGGYQWTFGDLTDAETRQLYAIVRRRGISRSMLVVEDPEVTVGLNERLHWSLFDRLEAYERLTVGATRYGFRVRDWA